MTELGLKLFSLNPCCSEKGAREGTLWSLYPFRLSAEGGREFQKGERKERGVGRKGGREGSRPSSLTLGPDSIAGSHLPQSAP